MVIAPPSRSHLRSPRPGTRTLSNASLASRRRRPRRQESVGRSRRWVISRLKIPIIFGLDVIHGYRTTFPVPLALSATWDANLVERVSRIAAAEATSAGIRWTVSPMGDIAPEDPDHFRSRRDSWLSHHLPGPTCALRDLGREPCRTRLSHRGGGGHVGRNPLDVLADG